MKKMLKILSFTMILAMASSAVLAAAPTTITGTIQGFNCVAGKRTCPIGREDALAATEKVFVLLAEDWNYYFVPNLARTIMARHINKQVRITGKLDTQHRSLRAETLEAFEKGQWRQTWSRSMQEKLQKEMDFLP